MASEKTQASFDAITSKLNNLTAKDDSATSKEVDAKKEEVAAVKPEGEDAPKAAGKLDEPGM